MLTDSPVIDVVFLGLEPRHRLFFVFVLFFLFFFFEAIASSTLGIGVRLFGACGDFHPLFFSFNSTSPNSHHALLKRAASPRLLLSPLPFVCFFTVGLTLLPLPPPQKIIAWISDHGWSYAQETDSNHNSISTPALCLSSHALSPLRLMFWFPPCLASSLFSFKFKCMLSVMNLQ